MLLLGWEADWVTVVVWPATLRIPLSGTRLLPTQQLDILGGPYRLCVCQVNAEVLEGKAQRWTTQTLICLNIEDWSTLGLFSFAWRARREAFFRFYIEALQSCLLSWPVFEVAFSIAFAEEHEKLHFVPDCQTASEYWLFILSIVRILKNTLYIPTQLQFDLLTMFFNSNSSQSHTHSVVQNRYMLHLHLLLPLLLFNKKE